MAEKNNDGKIGLWSLLAMVVGSMVGAGFFMILTCPLKKNKSNIKKKDGDKER